MRKRRKSFKSPETLVYKCTRTGLSNQRPLMRQKADDLAAKMGQKEFVDKKWLISSLEKTGKRRFQANSWRIKVSLCSSGDQRIGKELPKLIASYALQDVYNALESGLYV
ncbi:hypothetical protein AVEN_249490-1 [Araneus ventricosus]|uniref:Uncharacterized protein n=1 Tax=Araneus ventricosus TaxID=182803 RepID=A0A4Y2KSM0_ARAVE|nr:hypothetical protein AVEN_249490-1 [Araneus ventricosus]